ncbi:MULTISPECIES: hypothetical protein [unclassified Streptomyces]|uniref:hypothetical protein n=1 Tax=unclassified Streptomyces TaxID=2593676 RepID=UPI000DB9B68D|nr:MULTISPECIES: hypothetical protein [unclassified Streptomyces]MYT74125.1 hypothetical protein [Streptomyces sp. SID8367]RAJ89542.1 hypothetical protein K377_01667 [Streptomyces sp. PsTaAH-137]
MTGSTPPWKRRTWSKRRDAAQGPSEAVRDDERGSFPGAAGEDASLESQDGHETTGDPAAAVPARAVDDAVELYDTDPAAETHAARVARGRAAAVRDGVRRSGDLARAGMAKGGSAARTGMAKGGAAAKAGIGYLADQIIKNAPRVPVRDLATLRKQFPGLEPERLADKLITGAANATSTVGAGVGAAAMLPVPPAMPTELAAEITGVAAIELKLIAELHEVYGLRPPGGLKDRSAAYLHSWSDERGIDVKKPMTVNAALGGQMKRELRQQIMKRMVRNLPSLTPFMVGAAVGAVMNRRDTKKLAERIRKDLRAAQVPWDELGDLPPLEAPEDPLELSG